MKRYDRERSGGGIRRLHQEDFCQALGIPPEFKYQGDGGPGCGAICDALWTHSRTPADDVRAFAGAIMMNWLIGGTDAHAKNYSLLIGPKESVRLAPLYDVATILPHATHTRRLRMSNEVGGRYRLDEVRARHWARFAADVRLPSEVVRDVGLRMARRLPSALSEVVANARDCGIDHPIMDALVRKVSARAEDCVRILEGLEPISGDPP